LMKMQSCFCVSVLQLLLSYSKSGGDSVAESIAIFGLENMSVQLPCPPSDTDTPHRVQWFDLVYNMNPDPTRIFDSRNNTNRRVHDLHPNRVHYGVSGLIRQSYSQAVHYMVYYFKYFMM